MSFVVKKKGMGERKKEYFGDGTPFIYTFSTVNSGGERVSLLFHHFLFFLSTSSSDSSEEEEEENEEEKEKEDDEDEELPPEKL